MIKTYIYIIIFSLFVAGCAERGSIVQVTPIHTIQNTKTEVNQKRNGDYPTLKLNSSRENKMQKNISGSLILIIGLILIL